MKSHSVAVGPADFGGPSESRLRTLCCPKSARCLSSENASAPV